MYRYCCLSFALLVLLLTPYGQRIQKLPEEERLYRYAEKLYASPQASNTSDSLALGTYQEVIVRLNHQKKYNATLADSYLKSGLILLPGNQQQQALAFFRQAIATITPGNHLPDSLLFQPYLYQGTIHYNLNELDSAVYYFNKAEALNEHYGGLNENERLFNKFGALYYETGDYKKSINYFEKALSIIEEKQPSNVFFIVNYKNNIATALLKLGEYQKALKIFTGMLQYHLAQGGLYYNIASAYQQAGMYNDALKFFRGIQQMDIEKFNGLTKVFIQLEQYDSARFYSLKAQQIFSGKNDVTKTVNYGITLKYAGDLDAATGNHLQAINHYQRAISFLYPSFADTSIGHNPVLFTGLQNFNLLFDVLMAKAASLNQLANSNPAANYLQYALNAYTSAIALASHIERTYFSDDARLFLKQKVNPATQQAVDVALRLFKLSKNDARYLNTCFSLVEGNKASVLQAALQNLQLPALAGIPANLLAQEKKYKTLITKLAIQAARVNDSVTLAALQKQNQDNEIILAGIQKKLEENLVYHQLKFNTSVTNIDSVQQLVAADEAILSYYYTPQQLLCFYITKQGRGVCATPLKRDFFSGILALRKQLEDPQAASRNALQAAGTMLFNSLVAPVMDKIKTKKHLIIIPYNEISYVPFELMQNPEDQTLLLKTFAVSYNYSVNFITTANTSIAGKYNVLAMAPFAETGNGNIKTILPLLPASADETDKLPGEKLQGKAATKKQFEVLAGSFPIIHLATHAVANDANPLGSYIEFYGLQNDADTLHRLYVPEIYNLDMKDARLLILSACETGTGLLVNGEGVMSLSRAFSYAGCKSVVTSLWKADDMATAFIVKRLHYYLQKGSPADEALQKAKLDYINSNDVEDRFKSPAYWAHLVLIGDHQPLVATGFHWYWVVVIILLTCFFFILFLKKGRA